ncbi:SpoIIE family protein phosphatase [Cryptosporangium minutisporangium]|uniref:Anti-sigma regulatory factor n=1 Tax=Cryptosporangium minutisporangium TaxID=113569 RepID=A0ABP6SSH3_9ACTN
MGAVADESMVRNPHHRQVAVGDDTAVGEARRIARKLATDVGADELGGTRAELVATELATNLLRHADAGGWMLLRTVPPSRVEILAVDRGPGIRDPAAALAGRAPAPKGLGCGLASARRASCLLDLYTRVGSGTVVLGLVDVTDADASAEPRQCAGVSIGLSEACGDGWAAIEVDSRLAVAVVDGIGHGTPASAATDVVLDAFGQAPTELTTFTKRANEVARGTRGAVATVCVLDPDTDSLSCVAVGNVNGRVLAGTTEKGLITFSGSLGLAAQPPSAKIQTHDWPAEATLVLWTDGLRSRLDLAGYPGLFAHDPAVVAAVLHRDYGRGTDDATVVVARRPVATGNGPR